MSSEMLIFFLALLLFGSVQADVEDDLAFLKTNIESVTRQMMLQQFFTEERVRSEGNSGIKQIRLTQSGSRNYFQESFVGVSPAAMFNRANTVREVGLGEFVAVLNGIEFRTRQNKYPLNKPHSTSDVYHDIEEVPFPRVPPEVTGKGSVEDQIIEMQEFFKAWKDQNITHRDYTPYFKPIMCYLEGGWTNPKEPIEEPFESSVKLNANSFEELMDKIRYSSHTGYKSPDNDIAFLPTKVITIEKTADNITIPLIVQWNYRILCHPLKNDLPLSRLRPVEDVKNRLPEFIERETYPQMRSARYQLNTVDEEIFYELPVDEAFLDDLMAEIPGKENYQGYLEDAGFDEPALDIGTGLPKDVSRYHRWYRSKSKDAMGLSTVHRAFSDDGFYGAMTTQSEIAGMAYEKCVTKKKVTTCASVYQRWSYAIPLEIIYLSPLNAWNPYGIEYKGEADTDLGKTVTEGGRNGDCAIAGKELDGSNSNHYYLTPKAMFSGSEIQTEPSDTNLDKVCVLDNQGRKQETTASGIRIHFPEIPGVGVLRQRYPIFPVHGEGSAVWKELNAVRDMVMDAQAKAAMKHGDFIDMDVGIVLKMGLSHSSFVAEHTHTVELAPWEVQQVIIGHARTKTTSISNGHHHVLEITWDSMKEFYRYLTCDGRPKPELCFDNHEKRMYVVST